MRQICAERARHEWQVPSGSDAEKTYTVLWPEGEEPTCKCVAFAILRNKRKKAGDPTPPRCKHIEDLCRWAEGEGNPQFEAGQCPECGGPTVAEGAPLPPVREQLALPAQRVVAEDMSGLPKLKPMLANSVDPSKLVALAENAEMWFEQKLDGHRLLLEVNRTNEAMGTRAVQRNGAVSQHNDQFGRVRYSAQLRRLPEVPLALVLDGEWLDGTYYVFDLPYGDIGEDHHRRVQSFPHHPYYHRRLILEELFVAWAPDPALFSLVPVARTEREKLDLSLWARKNNAEGIMVKDRLAPYQSGVRSSAIRKAKFTKTADLIVSNVGLDGKDNASFCCYKDGHLVAVGRASTIGKPALVPGDVCEVKYLYLGADKRLVQPTILSKRTDKDPHECTYDQLVPTNKEVLSRL